jgi:phytoene/squalene synthetase
VNTTASLARSITWASSKQSYLTAWLLADRDLKDDCLRAYAYFRWADDMIDIHFQSSDDRAAFIVRQQALIENLYRGERPADLCPQEEMLADLIANDRGSHSGLQSFIRNFMTVIAFDANRRGHIISQRELSAYMNCLGTAVMDGLLYFIGNQHSYPRTPDRTQAVIGAHLTHMLRDMQEDLPAGFINVPAEDITAYGIDLDETNDEAFREWVRRQVEEAKRYFQEGQGYIDSLDVLRAKLAGVWYCARFECILGAIQRDGYQLRCDYPERRCWRIWIRMIGLGIAVTLKHFAGQVLPQTHKSLGAASLLKVYNKDTEARSSMGFSIKKTVPS